MTARSRRFRCPGARRLSRPPQAGEVPEAPRYSAALLQGPESPVRPGPGPDGPQQGRQIRQDGVRGGEGRVSQAQHRQAKAVHHPAGQGDYWERSPSVNAIDV